jgi:hypothetical protein
MLVTAGTLRAELEKFEFEILLCELRASVVNSNPDISRRRRGGRVFRLSSGCAAMKNSARGDSSTGSELKAIEEACREASRTVEPCELCCLCGKTNSDIAPRRRGGRGVKSS